MVCVKINSYTHTRCCRCTNWLDRSVASQELWFWFGTKSFAVRNLILQDCPKHLKSLTAATSSGPFHSEYCACWDQSRVFITACHCTTQVISHCTPTRKQAMHYELTDCGWAWVSLELTWVNQQAAETLTSLIGICAHIFNRPSAMSCLLRICCRMLHDPTEYIPDVKILSLCFSLYPLSLRSLFVSFPLWICSSHDIYPNRVGQGGCIVAVSKQVLVIDGRLNL